MNNIEELTDLFRRFPGIGPRQARRFVYFLLFQNENYKKTLAEKIIKLKDNISNCKECFSFFQSNKTSSLCPTCADPSTDKETLMIVAKDADFETIKKTGVYKGRFFILGGLVPILEKNPENKIRLKELKTLIYNKPSGEIKEIILALSVNSEGDYTANYLKNYLQEISEQKGIQITLLGRGLSTGIELEYSDSDTLTHALKHRE